MVWWAKWITTCIALLKKNTHLVTCIHCSKYYHSLHTAIMELHCTCMQQLSLWTRDVTNPYSWHMPPVSFQVRVSRIKGRGCRSQTSTWILVCSRQNYRIYINSADQQFALVNELKLSLATSLCFSITLVNTHTNTFSQGIFSIFYFFSNDDRCKYFLPHSWAQSQNLWLDSYSIERWHSLSINGRIQQNSLPLIFHSVSHCHEC